MACGRGSTLQCGSLAGQVALGWHAIEFPQTSVISEFYVWFRSRPYQLISPHGRHVILHQSAKFLSKSDCPWQKKMTLCRFSRWQISTILDFRGPTMVAFKSLWPIYDFLYRSPIKTIKNYITLNCLVFEKIGFLPRDAMHKRGLCRHAMTVRPSVCVSVTFVDHVKNE